MPTRLDLIRRAQARIGDVPIDAEDDEGADTHIAVYESTLEALLGRHPWKFAKVTRRLPRLMQPPPVHWKYLYQLPAEMLGAPRAVYDGAELRVPLKRYELTENRLAADAEEIWLAFGRRAEPGLWPSWFAELFTVVLMSEFAVSIREDMALRRELRGQAFGPDVMEGHGGMMAECRLLDAQSEPSAAVDAGYNPLVDARFS